MRRLLFWSVGIDSTHVRDRPVERARYTSAGLALVLTAITAAAGMILLLWQITGEMNWPVFIPIALLWAALIFNVDRALVSSFNYGPMTDENVGEAPRQHAVAKFVTYGARVLLALVVALAVAEPAMIALFRPEVEQQLAKTHSQAVAAAEQRVRDRFAGDRADIDAVLAKAQTASDTAVTEATRAQKEYDDEVNGTGGTRRKGCTPGPASPCTIKREAWLAAEKRKADTAQALADARTKHTDALAILDGREKEEVKSERAKIEDNRGFLASEQALDEVIAEHPSLWLRRILISFLFIMVDLLPVLIKLFGPLSLHDRSVRRLAVEEVLVQEEKYQADRHFRRANHEHDKYIAQLAVQRERDKHQMQHDVELERLRLNQEFEFADARMAHEERLRALRARFNVTELDPNLGGSQPRPHDGRLILNDRWVVENLAPPGGDLGGMGETRIAHDINDPSYKVVVKRYRRSQDAGDGRLAAQFQKELVRHSAVASRHVAPVVDSGDHPLFGVFLITKLYPDTLAHKQHRTRPPRPQFTPTLGWSLRIIDQVLAGLADCWATGIVHLDIKPANIALDHDDVVKLIDFGLAKVAVGGAVTTTGVHAFTYFYAAPEQIERKPKNWCSSACDVRATGATLYELLTGQPPMQREAVALGILGPQGFDSTRMADFLTLLREKPPIRPIELVPGLPPIVDEFVMHTLEPQRSKRPRDVIAAAEELRAVTRSIIGKDAEYLAVGAAHVLDARGGEGAA